MKITKASIRYAKALFQLALGQNKGEAVLSDLIVVSTIVNNEQQLASLIKNPTINQREKNNVFYRLFAEKINKITMDFITLVIKKGRESFLLDIIAKYQEIYNQHHNIGIVEIVSAEPLSDNLKDRLKEKTSLNGGRVQLKERIDKSLIGGFIIKRGDLQYDASIRKKLNNAKRAFKL